jgi:hypothetical protein
LEVENVTGFHEEVRLSWSIRVRQVHRWSSIAFTAGVVVVTAIIARSQGEPDERVYFLTLLPLGVLLVTGLYLFVLPHAARLRRRRRAVGSAFPGSAPRPTVQGNGTDRRMERFPAGP